MSTEQDKSNKPAKDMSGYIAKNDNRTNDKQPHWRGKVRINGKELLLSLWEKNDNPNIMNLSVTDPDTLASKFNNNSTNQVNADQNSSPRQSVGNASSPSSDPANQPSSEPGSGGAGDPFGDLFGSLPGG